jgi:uncharacterized protein (TIGR02118 family)
MLRITVLYPSEGGTRFDHDYYATQHVALVRDVYGDRLLDIEVTRGVEDADGNPPAYVATAHLLFADFDDEYMSRRAVGRPRIAADAPNFTDIRPITYVGEIAS